MDHNDDWHVEGEASSPAPVLDAKPSCPGADAKRQRQAEKREDRLRRLEVWFAGAVAVFALVQAGVSYWQWDVMNRQLKLADQQMELSERPWIKATFSVAEPFVIRPDGAARIAVNVVMENTGRSVAGQVHVSLVLATQRWKGDFVAAAKSQQDEACWAANASYEASRATTDRLLPRPTIFPDDTFTQWVSIGMTKEELDAGRGTFDDPSRYYVAPLLAGCIVYGFPFDPTRHGEYRALYTVDRVTPDSTERRAIEAIPGTTPIGELRLAPYPFGGHGAVE